PHSVGTPLFKGLTPLLWLVLVEPNSERARNTRFARATLGLVSVYLALYAFPVASAQVSLSLAVMLISVAVFLHDSFLTLQPYLKPAFSGPGIRKLVAASVAFLLASLYLLQLASAIQTYESLVSLGLSGAERVRVTIPDKNVYGWLTSELDTHCDTFFSMPGLFSLYFWTRKDPPTRLLMSDWIGLLNAPQQQKVVDDLSTYNRECIVYSPRVVEFWRRGQDLSRSPLARYIHDQFISIDQRDGYYFMIRKAQ
nr:hypothetical protein [Acidobacteriota bacterium]